MARVQLQQHRQHRRVLGHRDRRHTVDLVAHAAQGKTNLAQAFIGIIGLGRQVYQYQANLVAADHVIFIAQVNRHLDTDRAIEINIIVQQVAPQGCVNTRQRDMVQSAARGFAHLGNS